MAKIYFSKNGAWYDACDSSISKNGTWYGLSDVSSFSVMKDGVWYTNECGLPIPRFGGFNEEVYTIRVTENDDNKILVGGSFTTYSGITSNRIIKLNNDGTIDNIFYNNIGVGFNVAVRTIEVQLDNKILVGGEFTTFSGITYNRIIRLNNDGSIDNTFSGITTGFNGTVRTIKETADNKILVGGEFTTFSGITYNRIIRLNNDGSIDNTFSGITTGFNGNVGIIKETTDNKILVGGSFNTYNSVDNRCLARLNNDASNDTPFSTATNALNGIQGTGRQVIDFWDDGNEYIIVGQFNTYNGNSTSNIFKITSGGTYISNFASSGTTSAIRRIEKYNNKYFLAGNLSTYSGVSVSRMIKLNNDSTIDNTFTSYGYDSGIINDLYIRTDSNIITVGTFTTYSGVTKQRILITDSGGTALY
jgi:uncharacterized delta-60 repeat protein